MQFDGANVWCLVTLINYYRFNCDRYNMLGRVGIVGRLAAVEPSERQLLERQ